MVFKMTSKLNFLKFLLFLLFLMINCEAYLQNENKLENKIINLIILKNPMVTDINFNKGKYIYQQTIEELKKNSYKFSYIDYWNFTLALTYLDENREVVEYCFKKAYDMNSENVCVILNRVYYSQDEISVLLQNKLLILPATLNICNKKKINKINDEENIIVKDNITKLIVEIQKNDQRYRGEDFNSNIEKQNLLDRINQFKIDSLFNEHKEYIGKSHVGIKNDHVMWSVIQHSNIEMMTRYLPVVHQAVIEGELPLVPLQMLIDRIYTIETGKQIFGSQGGVEISAESIVNEVKEKYNIK